MTKTTNFDFVWDKFIAAVETSIKESSVDSSDWESLADWESLFFQGYTAQMAVDSVLK